ncbi:helix-turn-helix transcriptional regulator [Xanthomonas cucurbitae]|nr:helix-turn-helix transcriptional regulator [Xanthomonas cucurbitae]WDM67886.1 helix-turn-helix domain-containing protein [Xanthomonas cucurbitae]WDM71760.1 helix-turn-helix domain-containing protein [Xanthomonas cucurbitae]WDM78996.1 helix-turn-helix domain-containing protein [Xanthomonas cucurbitae]WDM82679.1 helix-turn-helix domain-containing protein [Xanthomonas cucurbitae]
MRRLETAYATSASQQTAQHLATLVKNARIARGWSQLNLAERARISPATMSRIEQGNLGASLGTWLAVFERLGLLAKFAQLRDPASEAILDSTRAKRPLRSNTPDMDF